MPYIVTVFYHDFMGKFQIMKQFDQIERDAVLDTARRLCAHPFSDPVPEVIEANDFTYSAIVWEGTLDDAYEGTLGKPVGVFYLGEQIGGDDYTGG